VGKRFDASGAIPVVAGSSRISEHHLLNRRCSCINLFHLQPPLKSLKASSTIDNGNFYYAVDSENIVYILDINYQVYNFFLQALLLLQMLLLFFLLQEEQEVERRRLLIDTLLHLSKSSAASVSRLAGVKPANLSAFRRADGGNRVSPELQERLLAALGWRRGEPDPEVRHEWVVRDQNSLIALKWILRDRSTADAVIVPSSNTSSSALDIHWNGNLVSGGAPCQITVGSYLKLPDGSDVQSMMSSLIGEQTSARHLDHMHLEAKLADEVAKNDLHEIHKGDKVTNFDRKSKRLFDQRQALGITDELMDQLIENWIFRQARLEPDALLEQLSDLESLQISGQAISPRSMTKAQLRRFIEKLGR
jgi:hypothetical protein